MSATTWQEAKEAKRVKARSEALNALRRLDVFFFGREVGHSPCVNGPFKGEETVRICLEDCYRFGVLVTFGDSRTFLVADHDGCEVVIVISDNPPQVAKHLSKLKKNLRMPPMYVASIKGARMSGIAYEVCPVCETTVSGDGDSTCKCTH